MFAQKPETVAKFYSYTPLIVSLLLFFVLRHFYFWQIGDDSYIYFRYVERALAGKWWSWSDHIPPVEGYSSPLWYFLLILTSKLGFSVEIAARTWGLIFSFLSVIATWYLSRELRATVFFSGIACLLLVLNHGFNFWATAGLETSLYMFLYLTSCLGIIRERYWLLPTAFIGIARPEGLLLLVAILLSIFIVKREKIPLRFILLCSLPSLLWLSLRIYIYEMPLPNTFYAKATGGINNQILRGIIYSLPVLMPLIFSWVFWLKGKDKNILVALGMVTLLLGLVILGGGDWMYYFRLLIPCIGIILAVIASQFTQTKKMGKSIFLFTLSPLLYFSVPFNNLMLAFSGDELAVQHYQEGNMTHASIAMAQEIQRHFPKAKLMAVNHAGALPWSLEEYNVIDMVGLNDAVIARSKGQLHKKYNVQYVLDLRPDLIVLNSRVKPGTDGIWYHKGYWAGEDALIESDGFKNYEATDLVYAWQWQVPFPYNYFVTTGESSWILLYARKDI